MLTTAWKKTGHLVIIAAVIGLLYFIGSGTWGGSLTTRWYWIMGIMAGFIMLIGTTTNGRLDGALIDWRNKMSLSHLQVTLWTILGMSAFLTVGLARIASLDHIGYKDDSKLTYQQAKAVGDVACLEGLTEKDITKDVLDKCPAPDALLIIFPSELLLAMGISLASFAGSALVKNSQSNTTLVSADEDHNIQDKITQEIRAKETAAKRVGVLSQEIDDMKVKLKKAQDGNKQKDIESANTVIASKNEELKKQQKTVEDSVAKITELETELAKVRKDQDEAKGLLHVRKDPKDAQWSDIFTKEISGESDLIDLSKLQMFFFTITVIFAYAAALNNLLQQPELIENPFGVALPLFSSSLVVLLGISHGGYLALKNTDTSGTNTRK
jgi:TolA-binding protein